MDHSSIFIVMAMIALFAFAGIPIAFSLAISSGIGLYFTFGSWAPALNLIQQTAFYGIKDYNYVVIPLFTAMGMLIAYCGAAADIFNVVNSRLKGVPGRLAVAAVGGNAIFAAVTGVGLAAAAAFSAVAYPVMRDAGYRRGFAAASIAGSSILGLLIPPSILMIVWGLMTEQSVGHLFAAGVMPGLLLATFYTIYCVGHAKIDPAVAPSSPEGVAHVPQSNSTRRAELLSLVGVMILIFVTLGAIWGGIATPTEGAAIGFVGAIILAKAKGLAWRRQLEAIADAGQAVTPILILIISALMYAKYLALEDVPGQTKSLLIDMGLGSEGTLIFMVFVWLVLGTMIDSISIMLLTVPIFWPLAQSFGFDPIVFALIGILVIEAGILTPPMGIGVFVVQAAVQDPMITLREIFVGVIPYWLLILALAYLIYQFPLIATWLPSKF